MSAVLAPASPGAQITTLRPRPFRAHLRVALSESVSLLKIRTDNFRVRMTPDRDRAAVTFPLTTPCSFASRHGLLELGPGLCHIANSDSAFDLQAAHGTFLVLIVKDSLVAELDGQLRARPDAASSSLESVLDLSLPAGRALWQAAARGWSAATSMDLGPEVTLARVESERELAARLVSASHAQGTPAAAPRRGDHREAVRRVEEWVVANLQRPISRADLCAVAGLDVRTLSRAFRRCRDRGPMAFVIDRRLDAAARALLIADRDETTVTKTALDHGFEHLSRFAGMYRRAFGEAPSETLAR